MLNEQQVNIIGDALSGLYQNLEQEIIADIARRISKTLTYTRTAELQAGQMAKLGFSPSKIRSEAMKLIRADKKLRMEIAKNTLEYKRTIRDLISETTREAYLAGNDIIANAGNMAWVSDLSVWRSAGKNLNNKSALHNIVGAIQRHTGEDIKNITQSTGFRGVGGMEPLMDAYQTQLDRQLIKITSGTFTAEQCVVQMVKELANSGVRSIKYASGRSYQLDDAARMSLRTAANQLSANIMDANLKETNEGMVQVSAHWDARDKGEGIKNHASWQGKVYSTDGKSRPDEEKRIEQKIEDLKKITGYDIETSEADVIGLHGVNCRHLHFVFFEGISTPIKYPPEPEPVTINGKPFTYYDMTQEQRRMEREIRQLKRERDALQSLGIDTNDIDSMIRLKTMEYKNASADFGINPRTDRLRYQSGTSDITKTAAYKDYQKMVNNNLTESHRDSTIMETKDTVQNMRNTDVIKVGEINPKRFENAFPILTKDVIITRERIEHIKDHHPEDYERYAEYIPQILEEPDYILEDNLPNSAVLLKCFAEDDKRFQLILRLKAVEDNTEYKNSVITFMKIEEKRYKRYLRTKNILYKAD